MSELWEFAKERKEICKKRQDGIGCGVLCPIIPVLNSLDEQSLDSLGLKKADQQHLFGNDPRPYPSMYLMKLPRVGQEWPDSTCTILRDDFEQSKSKCSRRFAAASFVSLDWHAE